MSRLDALTHLKDGVSSICVEGLSRAVEGLSSFVSSFSVEVSRPGLRAQGGVGMKLPVYQHHRVVCCVHCWHLKTRQIGTPLMDGLPAMAGKMELQSVCSQTSHRMRHV